MSEVDNDIRLVDLAGFCLLGKDTKFKSRFFQDRAASIGNKNATDNDNAWLLAIGKCLDKELTREQAAKALSLETKDELFDWDLLKKNHEAYKERQKKEK
ncbi:hypothetical protein [Hyphococcus sp.]|uniref:hypothetical protein n=1 Tax=Hyphococcus sp. TaxID=2038636 RepID=UPI0035C72984